MNNKYSGKRTKNENPPLRGGIMPLPGIDFLIENFKGERKKSVLLSSNILYIAIPALML